MSKVRYANILDGKFCMTYDEVVQLIKDNPQSSDPYSVFFIGNDGTEYSIMDIARKEKIELDVKEEN